MLVRNLFLNQYNIIYLILSLLLDENNRGKDKSDNANSADKPSIKAIAICMPLFSTFSNQFIKENIGNIVIIV